MLPAMPDSELLAGACAGDCAAFATLYDRYRAIVYRISRNMLGDDDAAEDVVQSVFISIWLAPPASEGGSFVAWLTCVTKNRARDVLRARRARREATWPANLVNEESFYDAVHARLEDRRVRAALAALPETQRSLIELGFYGERSHAELAALTRLPLGTVKTRIRTGLQRLRFTLGATTAQE